MTTATAHPWPTVAEIADAARLVADAYTAIDELGNFHFIAEEAEMLDIPGPTREQLAALSWFIECAGTDIEHMTVDISQMREARKRASWRIKLGGESDA